VALFLGFVRDDFSQTCSVRSSLVAQDRATVFDEQASRSRFEQFILS